MTNNRTIVADISDNEIISRILRGERELYARIIRKYNQRLYRVGMSIINDDAEVEDAMQVAYIKAYENLGKFEFKAAFSTWLTKILINESLLRRKKRIQLSNISYEMNDNKISQHHQVEPQTPLMNVINSELKVILEKAIRQLPEKYRMVFIMREIEDMNVAETRECLDLSEANVKVRLNRAKALLKNSLAEYYHKEDILNFHLLRCDRIVDHVMKQINSLETQL
ncbi:MAG: RNA polymerase sigma factor [Ginsengibacter sp.]